MVRAISRSKELSRLGLPFLGRLPDVVDDANNDRLQNGDIARFDYFVDSVNGSDISSGRYPFQAKATLASVPWADGIRVGVARGSEFREAFPTLTYNDIVISTYGAGVRPKVYGSVRHTSSWTVASGDTYTKAIGYLPLNVFRVSTLGVVTKLSPGTLGSLTNGQWAGDGTSVQINVGEDPNGSITEIPGSASNSGIGVGGDRLLIEGIDSWFWSFNGARADAANDVFSRGLDLRYNCNDGFGVINSASNIYILNAFIQGNGQTRTTSGAPGDGISFHDTCTGRIEGCSILDNCKSAIGNQQRCVVDVYRNYMRNNYTEVAIFPDGSSTDGQHTVAFNVIVFPSTNITTSGHGAITDVLVSAGSYQVKCFNNTLFHSGSPSSGITGIRAGRGTWDCRNNIINGFSRGFARTSSNPSTLTNDFNCVSGNTDNFWNNGDPGVVQGANDITVDPSFVDSSVEDLGLSSDSPCIGTGTDVRDSIRLVSGHVLNFAGVEMTTNNMGAF